MRLGEELPKLPNPADGGRWRRLFEDKIIVARRARGLTRTEAEPEAYRAVVADYLNATHPNTSATRCAGCGRAETPGATLLPMGWGERHVWLHSGCWDAWREARRAVAIAELAAMGLSDPRPGNVINLAGTLAVRIALKGTASPARPAQVDYRLVYEARHRELSPAFGHDEAHFRAFDHAVNVACAAGHGREEAKSLVLAAIAKKENADG
jgi:hypothetical protein